MYNIYRNYFLLIAMLLLGQVTYAQKLAGVKGKIVDDNGPLPSAMVLIKGTNKGTTTDLEGHFQLGVDKAGNYTLEIAFLGYKSIEKQITITDNQLLDIGTISMVEDASELTEVVVMGSMKASEAKALSVQRASLNIKNVLSTDGIGKLPDRNAAEAVQRIAGVSIERDQGEGRFVAVRGLPADWSSATINGDRIPAAEEETGSRASAFDFFPSDLIEMVEVSKAITPDMEADAMGGSVNFITKTAPDSRTLNVTLGGGANQKAAGGIYSANVLYGDRSKNGKFGYILNGTIWDRAWATDNYEPRRKSDGVYRLELRDYDGRRRTVGFNGGMEYNFNENSKITARGVYGTLNDHETHFKHRLRFDKIDTDTGEGRVELQHIDNILITEMWGAELAGDHKLNSKTKVDWKLSSYDNQFYYGDIPDGQDNSYFLAQFNQSGVPMNVGMLESGDDNKNRLQFTPDGGQFTLENLDQVLGDDFQVDPSQMKLATFGIYRVAKRDRDRIVAQANIESNLSDIFTLKAGLKFRDKLRTESFSDEYYEYTGTEEITMANVDEFLGKAAGSSLQDQPGKNDYMSELNSSFSQNFSKVLDLETTHELYVKLRDAGQLKLLEDDSGLLSNGGAIGRNFEVHEQHISGYVMGTYKPTTKLTLIGGLRMTQTLTTLEGYNLVDGEVQPTTVENNYLSLLPMLHAKFQPSNMTNLRFAVTRTFARPSFWQMAPGGSYMSFDNIYTGGNPELKPTYSWNFDLMAEHFFGNVGVISGGVFAKSIADPVFTSTRKGDVLTYKNIEITAPDNGDNAWLAGVEANVSRQFDFLPGFLSGFGINANATFMKSEMTIPLDDGEVRETAIPRQADALYNIALYYEKGGFNARLAWNHKGAYIMEHGSSDAQDEIYGAYTTMDFTTSYKVSDKVMIFAEMNNLLNEPMTYYLGEEGRPLQVEYYGIRGQMGVKISLF
ncbi:TonB-dependent receptor [Limibacter armeniacum]|uniref:TonB-dependent receptor n=1 Tax=Limibacter armeniacum TaxID=466084 RepID=UPI002FE69AFE